MRVALKVGHESKSLEVFQSVKITTEFSFDNIEFQISDRTRENKCTFTF